MMKKFLLLVVLLISATFSFAQEAALLPNDPAVRVGKLDNGMTYYIRHNELPKGQADFYLATDAGALQEAPDQDGLAHFLEHMCFNGTKNFPGKNLLNWLESIGASFGGNVNAGTGIEQTVYMLTNIPLVRPTVVDSCVLIMHDYSHFVTCDPVEIDKERPVILEEKRTRNSASWRLREAVYPALYGDTKFGHTSIIGTEENLKTFKPESLTNFYHKWYIPNNQALIIVGDIDVDATEAIIKSTFADIPAIENPAVWEHEIIPHNDEPIVSIFTDPELTDNNIEVYFKSEALPKEMKSTPQGYAVELVKSIISHIINERLTDITAKAETPFLNSGFGFSSMSRTLDATIISLMPKEGKTLESLEAGLTELRKAALYGFTDAEIERAKTEIISRLEKRAKAADTRVNGELTYPLVYNFLQGEPYMDPATELQINQVLMAQLPTAIFNQVAAGMVTKDNIVVTYYGPEREGIVHPTEAQIRETIAVAENKEIENTSGEEIPSEFLNKAALKGSKASKAKTSIYGAQEYTLKNGVKVVLLPKDVEKNQVSFSIRKKGGLSLLNKEDVYSFETNLISLFTNFSGVSSFSKSTLNKMLAGKQLSVYPNIGFFYNSINGSTTTNDIETALQLAYLLFTDPRFDENEYNQAKNQLETLLPNMESTPDFILQTKLYDNLFKTPYQVSLTSENLAKANLETLKNGYKTLFNDAAGATFYMVGDFDIDTVLPLIEKYIGSIKKGKKAQNWGEIGDIYATESKLIDFNTVMQAPKVTFGQFYLLPAAYTIQDDVNANAMNYIYYMYCTNSLREQEGGTYGAQSAVAVNNAPINFRVLQVFCDTNVEQADRLRELAKEGIKNLAENGPSTEDFDKAKNNLLKTIPESKLNISYWMSAIQDYYTYGYDYVTDYEAAVNALTPEMIKSAANDYLNAALVEVVMRPE